MSDVFGTDWDPIEALKNLSLERALNSTESVTEQAKRLLSENLPVAVMAICHMATYSPTEAIRFNAAKYVIDRGLGPSDRMLTPDGKHAWEEIYEQVAIEASNYLAGE